jgi:8-oxo-dGTP pyrophosphatase MutT (NUDIX family)
MKGYEMAATPVRPRAAAAVLRNHNQEILMVKHRWRDGSTSWILPGGALLPQERPEEAAVRELEEETYLKGKVLRFLFTLPYKLQSPLGAVGTSTVFLVEVDADAQIALGSDPEEVEVEEEHKMLRDVAWFSIEEMASHPEVQRVIELLHLTLPGSSDAQEK